jgi:hypothetical protein
MSDELSPDIVALYRSTAREVPGERLDRIVLRKARAVAWRRRNRPLLLAMASCGTLALALGLWSAVTMIRTHSAVDTAQYGMTTGRVEFYLITASTNRDEPGMNVRPGFAKLSSQTGVE